jgi:hypothetical protein
MIPAVNQIFFTGAPWLLLETELKIGAKCLPPVPEYRKSFVVKAPPWRGIIAVNLQHRRASGE